MKNILLLLSIICLASCGSESNENEAQDSEQAIEKETKQRPLSSENGKFFEVDGKKMLFGGDSTQHFDISNSDLINEQFHYGIGREEFPALLKPEFISVAEADGIWHDTSRFLVAHRGGEVKVYAVDDLIHHEIVNDVLDGEPIMAAYCILADLGAIYSRQYGDKELTFALSGYTYFDEKTWKGLDGFILWDRETESLWWPLVGKAVSGNLKGAKLLEWDEANWEDTNWKKVKSKYPGARVLKSGQDFERPKSWGKIEDVSGVIDFSKTYNTKY